jgi:murein endopeptidase
MGGCRVLRSVVLLSITLWLTNGGYPALAEDYPECRLRCETEYTDCSSQASAPEQEVQDAKLKSCDQTLASCYADCENLKPVEVPEAVENNPNIIRK